MLLLLLSTGHYVLERNVGVKQKIKLEFGKLSFCQSQNGNCKMLR